MSKPLEADDPAYWMLQKGLDDQAAGREGWISKSTVYEQSCYICRDPEYALMGLPLCYPCPVCGAHIAADDTECENGHDAYEEHMKPTGHTYEPVEPGKLCGICGAPEKEHG